MSYDAIVSYDTIDVDDDVILIQFTDYISPIRITNFLKCLEKVFPKTTFIPFEGQVNFTKLGSAPKAEESQSPDPSEDITAKKTWALEIPDELDGKEGIEKFKEYMKNIVDVRVHQKY